MHAVFWNAPVVQHFRLLQRARQDLPLGDARRAECSHPRRFIFGPFMRDSGGLALHSGSAELYHRQAVLDLGFGGQTVVSVALLLLGYLQTVSATTPSR